MQTAIYARRSAERGDDYSLDTQADACRRYAAAHGLTVTDEYRDNHTGSAHLRDRPNGVTLWRAIERRQVGAVVVYTLDRLSRADIPDALLMMREMMRAGVTLHAIDTGPIENLNDIGLIVRSWQSSEERRKIIDRLQRGKMGKARSAWVGIGKPPYGLRKVGARREARLEIDPATSAVVRQMVDWLLVDGLRLRAIARRLNEARVSPPTTRTEHWNHTTVYRILSNRALLGELRYRSVTVTLPEVALIDAATFDQVQAVLDANRAGAARNRRREYLAAGCVKCQCGKSMIGFGGLVGGKTYQYYRCAQWQAEEGARTCTNARGIRAGDLDAAVWGYVLACAQPEALAAWRAELRASDGTQSAEPWRKRLAEIDREIDQARRRIAGLMAQYGDEARPEVAKQRDAAIDAANALIEERTKEREGAARRVADESGRLAQQSDALTAVEQARRKLERATFEQRRQVLEVAGVRVEIKVEGEKRTARIWSLIGPEQTVEV